LTIHRADTEQTKAKVTPRQAAFCTAYVECGNAAEAYRRAYQTDGKSAAAVNRAAKALLEKPVVAARIDALFSQAPVGSNRRDLAVTVESLTGELEAVRLASMVFGQAGSAVQAIMAKAKLHGLTVDRQDVKTRVSLDDMTDAELDAYIQRLEQEVARREAGSSAAH